MCEANVFLVKNGTEEEIMKAFRATRKEVKRRVESLLTLLGEGGEV